MRIAKHLETLFLNKEIILTKDFGQNLLNINIITQTKMIINETIEYRRKYLSWRKESGKSIHFIIITDKLSDQ